MLERSPELAFALLDDLGPPPAGVASAPDPAPRRSRRYTGLVREHRAPTPETLDQVWVSVEADQRAGLHAVVLADYEWGTALLGLPRPHPAASTPHEFGGRGDIGGLRVLMFRQLDWLSADEADAWLRDLDNGNEEPSPAGAVDLRSSIHDDSFDDAIARIREAIVAGETYQVNFTYRLHGQAHGSPVALYRRLRARQPVGYGALIALPPADGGDVAVRHVLSLSPELFLRHEAGVLTARPMKGTAPRHPVDPDADRAEAQWLQADTKNRAENLMIVDLLRNDLGRVAELGSVRVPALFAVEPYATVWQMTSTVQARLRAGVDMPALLRATFPCGSITGAPKHHTIELIQSLESTARGLYCGAIGWVDAPQGETVGDFCLSVAIRTLTLGEPEGGLAPLQLGVGAGIVLDSEAAGERAECQLKARFLTGLDPGFALIETMRFAPGAGVPLWPQHMARLAHSARALGFAFDEAALRTGFEALRPSLAPVGDSRVRLALSHDGRAEWRHAPLEPLPGESLTGAIGASLDAPVRLRWADERLPIRRPLAAHKTSDRAAYDRGVQAAQAEGAFDSLFLREDGVVLEGGRTSLFVRLDGRWWTPPLGDGVLAGVMRGQLLADAAWNAAERRLTRADVEQAEALVVCNALRGALEARLDRLFAPEV
ncbi:bifunctional anthranilate synthase component I family protein/class IV aminotransferase [Ideonella sp. DXS29W]|uniref:Bifunctional anthranilate synthase component I family protein/class IV aminotransferase n=1 Tax=Ideonella lacteola TaxID=2984193 RepID=A0ABU9BJE0_9BURK